jgi:hypothetical protein
LGPGWISFFFEALSMQPADGVGFFNTEFGMVAVLGD